jgi:hypothetical protein
MLMQHSGDAPARLGKLLLIAWHLEGDQIQDLNHEGTQHPMLIAELVGHAELPGFCSATSDSADALLISYFRTAGITMRSTANFLLPEGNFHQPSEAIETSFELGTWTGFAVADRVKHRSIFHSLHLTGRNLACRPFPRHAKVWRGSTLSRK